MQYGLERGLLWRRKPGRRGRIRMRSRIPGLTITFERSSLLYVRVFSFHPPPPTFSLFIFSPFTAYCLLTTQNIITNQGRPLRVLNNPYIKNWEENRAQEIKDLTSRGIVPVEHDLEQLGDDLDDETEENARPFLMGKAAAVINERKKAKEIVDEMVDDAVIWLERGKSMVVVDSSGGVGGRLGAPKL